MNPKQKQITIALIVVAALALIILGICYFAFWKGDGFPTKVNSNAKKFKAIEVIAKRLEKLKDKKEEQEKLLKNEAKVVPEKWEGIYAIRAVVGYLMSNADAAKIFVTNSIDTPYLKTVKELSSHLCLNGTNEADICIYDTMFFDALGDAAKKYDEKIKKKEKLTETEIDEIQALLQPKIVEELGKLSDELKKSLENLIKLYSDIDQLKKVTKEYAGGFVKKEEPPVAK